MLIPHDVDPWNCRIHEGKEDDAIQCVGVLYSDCGTVSFALQNVLIYGYTPTDSIFSVLQNRNTTWAEGYSKKQCSLVEVGMAEDEVLQLLGEPLVVENRKSGINWFYTSGPEGKVQGRVYGSTHVRRVLFKASKVSNKESFF